MKNIDPDALAGTPASDHPDGRSHSCASCSSPSCRTRRVPRMPRSEPAHEIVPAASPDAPAALRAHADNDG